MTTGIVIQARMSSTRLPGKVLTPVLGRPLLFYLIDRMNASRLADHVILATTTNPSDDEIGTLAILMDAGLHRGSEDDVLDRFLGAAAGYGLDIIVRVTADTPLLDPSTVDMLIARFLMGDLDHVEAAGLPDGAWAEVFSTDALHRIAADPELTDEDREHVTLRARRHPERYRLGTLDVGLGLDRERWTVDEPADLALVSRIIETLYPDRPTFTFADIRGLLADHPEWLDLNATVPPNRLHEEVLSIRAQLHTDG